MTKKDIKLFDVIAEYELRAKYNFDQRDYEAYSMLVKAREILAGQLKEQKSCATCKHLMFSDCYGECKLSDRIVTPNYKCDRWELKNG